MHYVSSDTVECNLLFFFFEFPSTYELFTDACRFTRQGERKDIFLGISKLIRSLRVTAGIKFKKKN